MSSPPRQRVQTRKHREFKTLLKRIVVGLFVLIFVSSIVGVALISVTSTAR